MKKKPQDDGSLLLRAAQRGDREAMTVIYERTVPQIRSTIRSIVQDEALVEDIQQETYLHAFSHLDQLRSPEKLLPWLRSIAKNLSKSALRKKAPLLFSELDHGDLPADTKDARSLPELAVEERERAQAVERVLAQLGDSQRLIVGMYYYEQRSVKEIAALLGISPGTVKSQLHRGKLRIKQELERMRKEEEGSLFGAGLFPAFVRCWRRLAEKSSAVRPILSRLPVQTAELACTSAKAVLFSRIAAAAAAVCVLGACVYGVGKLAGQTRHELGDMQPVEAPTEVQLTSTFPSETEPSEPTEEATEEPAEPTEEATEPTEEATEPPQEETPPEQAEAAQAEQNLPAQSLTHTQAVGVSYTAEDTSAESVNIFSQSASSPVPSNTGSQINIPTIPSVGDSINNPYDVINLYDP